MKRIFIILITVTEIVGVHARDFFLDNMTTANTADMIRYGDVSTSLFTGSLDFSIPIFSLEDPDFNLNVALNYTSDGFKPCKNSGYVGYNWVLIAGGCITREVRNYPDEIFRIVGTDEHKKEGMYHFLKYNSVDKYDVFAQNSNAVTNCGGSDSHVVYNIGSDCTKYRDYMPDIYHFSFCGYSGIFMINNMGEAIILSGDYVSVDLSKTIDLKSDLDLDASPLPVDTSQIIIKTKDGYTYIFGGELSALEYSIALKDGQLTQQQSPPVVNTWYLSKIIAPNKREVTYYYKGHENTHLLTDNNLLVMNMYLDLFAKKEDAMGMLQHDPHVKFTYTKECILDSIYVSGDHPLQLYFYNSPGQKMYNHTHFSLCKENYKLDSIHVVSNSRLIQSANLSYEYKSHIISNPSGFYWRFLSGVFLSGKGAYSFSYNHNSTYPDLYLEMEGGYHNVMDDYGYWKSYMSYQGLLREVRYPTGGKQQFVFEQNNYGTERRFRRINSNRDIELYSMPTNMNLTIGGARISQINTYANDSDLVEKKIFTYNISGTSTSSGIYYNHLQFFPESEYGLILGIKDGNNYSLLDTHIGYSFVEEQTKNGQGVTLYKNTFTYDTGTSSFSTLGNLSINETVASNDTSAFAALSSILTYDSNIYKKGQLLLEKNYKGDTLFQSVAKQYNGVPLLPNELMPEGMDGLGCVDTLVIFSNYGYRPITRKLYIYPDVLVQEVVNHYPDGENSIPAIMSNRNFLHDKKLRLIYETVVDSKWVTHFTRYKYPDNFNYDYSMFLFSPSPALWLLTKTHRINTPVEQISGYIDDDDVEYITSGKINIYDTERYAHPLLNDFPIFGAKAYYPYLYRTLSLNVKNPITDYQPMNLTAVSLLYDPRYKLTAEYSFNHMGRLLSVKPFGGIETKYRWNGIYPTSKKVGNQTTTYTFIPHVGLNSVTDPRGITTYYTYDKHGRLIETYQMVNNNKQMINAYKYHVKTE